MPRRRETRNGLKAARSQVLERYRSGTLIWGNASEPEEFRWYSVGLLMTFDDPEMGRPLWPPPKSGAVPE